MAAADIVGESWTIIKDSHLRAHIDASSEASSQAAGTLPSGSVFFDALLMETLKLGKILMNQVPGQAASANEMPVHPNSREEDFVVDLMIRQMEKQHRRSQRTREMPGPQNPR
ncbi:hypothetical protein [Bradyrhizobium ottawaense]|uniref:hypothetical protein n=1 Tax=Bradyrhizobium ottawaense TaxID=931866 RepID=UPI000485A2B5|nr:hypothetical protein [Bradyrhizobium ottawaense]